MPSVLESSSSSPSYEPPDRPSPSPGPSTSTSLSDHASHLPLVPFNPSFNSNPTPPSIPTLFLPNPISTLNLASPPSPNASPTSVSGTLDPGVPKSPFQLSGCIDPSLNQDIDMEDQHLQDLTVGKLGQLIFSEAMLKQRRQN